MMRGETLGPTQRGLTEEDRSSLKPLGWKIPSPFCFSLSYKTLGLYVLGYMFPKKYVEKQLPILQ